jgi:hypothetical protein
MCQRPDVSVGCVGAAKASEVAALEVILVVAAQDAAPGGSIHLSRMEGSSQEPVNDTTTLSGALTVTHMQCIGLRHGSLQNRDGYAGAPCRNSAACKQA